MTRWNDTKLCHEARLYGRIGFRSGVGFNASLQCFLVFLELPFLELLFLKLFYRVLFDSAPARGSTTIKSTAENRTHWTNSAPFKNKMPASAN